MAETEAIPSNLERGVQILAGDVDLLKRQMAERPTVDASGAVLKLERGIIEARAAIEDANVYAKKRIDELDAKVDAHQKETAAAIAGLVDTVRGVGQQNANLKSELRRAKHEGAK